MNTPDVGAYTNFREFLKDWFESERQVRPTLTHRSFAELVGQAGNPSVMSNVLVGRRNLSPALVDGFIEALRLNGRDAEYFRLLVEFDQAKTLESKRAALKRVLNSKKFRYAKSLEQPAYTYLSDWVPAAVRELAQCSGFQAEPKWIARTLRPTISVVRARKALNLLLKLEILTQEEDGTIRAAEPAVTTEPAVQEFAAFSYQHSMLERAMDGLMTILLHGNRERVKERYFGGLTMPVTPELQAEIYQELINFQERMVTKCLAAENPSQLYQLNFQFFPMSESTSATD